jgi:hypothetical protein
MSSNINFEMMTDSEINALDPDAFSDAIFDEVKKAPATLSDEEVRQLEEEFRQDIAGYARRGAFGILAQTGAHIIAAVAKDRPTAVAFADLYGRVAAYKGALTELLELVRQAEARLLVALANREDMTEIMAEVGIDAHKKLTTKGN